MRFFRKALRNDGKAEAIVTDGLKSYLAAMRELGNENRREIGSWNAIEWQNLMT